MTSGVYQSWVDHEGVCMNPWCDFGGPVDACEDTEDMTFTWACPVCERVHEDMIGEPPC